MEVGTSIIRISEVSKRGKSLEILDTLTFDLPEDAIQDGKVRPSEEIVAAIKNQLDNSGFQATDVYFAVESTKILYKEVELPAVTPRMIAETLRLSFSEYFPVDETLYHLSFNIKKRYKKEDKNMLLLDVFAIRNDLSESYYNLAVNLDLSPKKLSDTTHSMMSLFPSSFKHRTVAMININESLTTVSIIDNGNMLSNKTIPFGVSPALIKLMQSPSVDKNTTCTEAAAKLYTQDILMPEMPSNGIAPGASQNDQDRYMITTALNPMIRAIEKTLAAEMKKLRQAIPTLRVQEFQLSGLGAGFAGITKLLESEFGSTSVNVIQQDDGVRINTKAATDDLLISCFPSIGAILDDTNFFTPAEKAGGEVARQKTIDKYCIITGGLLCVAAVTYSGYNYMQAIIRKTEAEQQNVSLTQKVNNLVNQGVEDAYNKYQTNKSYYEQVNNMYMQTKSGNEDMTTFLKELESVVPRSARVMSLTLTPQTAEVSFVCSNKNDTAGLLHKLRNMTTISEMQCGGVAEVENSTELMFSCSFQLLSTDERNGKTPMKDEEGNFIFDENGNIVYEGEDEMSEETDFGGANPGLLENPVPDGTDSSATGEEMSETTQQENANSGVSGQPEGSDQNEVEVAE